MAKKRKRKKTTYQKCVTRKVGGKPGSKTRLKKIQASCRTTKKKAKRKKR